TQPWIIIVLDVGGANGVDLNRVAQAAVPGAHADRVTIETAIATERVLLTERLRDAALADGVTVVVVRDGTPGHFDLAAMERWVAEVDRLGFEPRQRVTWPIERCCALRPAAGPVGIKPDGRDEPTMEHAFRVERVTGARVSGVRFHARPLFERMEVMRTRPPARRWQRGPTGRLPLPEVIHRTSPWWRAHIAGYGGAGPGRAAEVLMRAGRHMGYAVNGQWNPEPIAHGRRAWAQVLFTRPRENEAPLPLTVRVPFGEADLLLGIEGTETLRALEGDATLRVAFAERSYAVVNAGGFGDEGDVTAASEREPALRQAVRACSRAQPRLLENVAEACRAWLHTDRAVDLALVGAAFQLGLMPLTLDALQQAVAEIEHAGAGRAVDAFQFGRHLAVDARLFNRPREREEDLSGLVRRFSHQIARRRRDRPVAGRFRALARWTIEAMPGLAETDPGRAALRDFVVATYHCLQWGGLDYAERYATLITDLYRGDRGAAGRSLTRAAVLPLASAMLIRDPIYVGTMTASAEQRRRIRQMLNIKRARADEMERRYLTRFELRTGMRRYQLDLRTSDWPARLLSSLRRIVPESWRGSRRERELRSSMIGLVQRVTANASADYERFQRTLLHLHERAANDHLQDMSPSELRVMVDAEAGGELESDTRS
ncbi:MAG: hypothetical protein HKO59_08745, partial [Phycisphaerales bacterium]|nr:hypothetical protein [Phycisphaerales bacterium]